MVNVRGISKSVAWFRIGGNRLLRSDVQLGIFPYSSTTHISDGF